MGLVAWAAQPCTIERYGPGHYDQGRWVDPAPTVITLQLAVLPARDRELLLLPEGDRLRDALTLYSDDPLQTADVTASRRADILIYRGDRWEVQRTKRYEGLGMLAYKSLALRMPTQPQGVPIQVSRPHAVVLGVAVGRGIEVSDE